MVLVSLAEVSMDPGDTHMVKEPSDGEQPFSGLSGLLSVLFLTQNEQRDID